jgi:hypothetical protein
MSRLEPLLFRLQKLLLILGYWFYSRRGRGEGVSISWVVGPTEIASMVHQIAGAVPGSHSVSLSSNAYYAYHYDSTQNFHGPAKIAALRRLIASPLLLAQLMVRARGFIYVGATGFLLDQFDQRTFEFAFLKKHGLKIVCYWTGSDIRSTRRMNELEKQTGLANISTYIRLVNPVFGTDAHESRLRKLAEVADRYADAMFSNSTDHLSYLMRPTEPFLYFLPDEEFSTDNKKFDDPSTIVVAHATTSPIIKGTQLVRAAVTKLKGEGYKFEYKELIGVSHDQIMSELSRTHISLNQFYGFSTAVYGMESLAARCAVLMSADNRIETDLQPGANQAWLVTRYYEVYENLKSLLDNPEKIEPLATRGRDWAFENGSRSRAGAILNGILESIHNGTYTPRAVVDGAQKAGGAKL